MSERKWSLKKLFSSSKKDCCNVEIEEAQSDEMDCCDSAAQSQQDDKTAKTSK